MPRISERARHSRAAIKIVQNYKRIKKYWVSKVVILDDHKAPESRGRNRTEHENYLILMSLKMLLKGYLRGTNDNNNLKAVTAIKWTKLEKEVSSELHVCVKNVSKLRKEFFNDDDDDDDDDICINNNERRSRAALQIAHNHKQMKIYWVSKVIVLNDYNKAPESIGRVRTEYENYLILMSLKMLLKGYLNGADNKNLKSVTSIEWTTLEKEVSSELHVCRKNVSMLRNEFFNDDDDICINNDEDVDGEFVEARCR